MPGDGLVIRFYAGWSLAILFAAAVECVVPVVAKEGERQAVWVVGEEAFDVCLVLGAVADLVPFAGMRDTHVIIVGAVDAIARCHDVWTSLATLVEKPVLADSLHGPTDLMPEWTTMRRVTTLCPGIGALEAKRYEEKVGVVACMRC